MLGGKTMYRKILCICVFVLFALCACDSNDKSAVPDSDPTTSNNPELISTPISTLDSSSSNDFINIFSNEMTKFTCPSLEYYGLTEEKLGSGFYLVFYSDGTFRIGYSETGGDYYYGRFEEIEENLFYYYGEVLDYTKLTSCEGEGCFIMPEITDKTIDGYTRLDGNTMYFIPHEISKDDLRTYSDDKGCIYNK